MTDMVYLFEEDEEKMQVFFDDDAESEDTVSVSEMTEEKNFLNDEMSAAGSEAEGNTFEVNSIAESNAFYESETAGDTYERSFMQQKSGFFNMEEHNSEKTDFLRSDVYGGDVLKAEIFESRDTGKNMRNGEKNISVTVNNNVSVTKDCDIDDVIERLSAKITEAVESAGEGMHI